MPEPTKSPQEAGRTTGASPGSPAGPSTGPSTGSMGAGMGAATTRSSREQSSSSYGSYGESGESSTMGRGMGETRRGVSDAYTRASQSLNETWEQAMDYSREHPGRSTLIAFGAGLGVGLLMASGFATRSRTRRIVPPVMNALSEIASELFR